MGQDMNVLRSRQRDPEVQMPQVRSGVTWELAHGRMQVRTSSGQHTLGTEAMAPVVRALLEAADGSTTATQVAEATGLRSTVVAQFYDRLWAVGAVELLPGPCPVDQPSDEPLWASLSWSGGVVQSVGSTQEALQRLGSRGVNVHGDGPIAVELRTALADAGVVADDTDPEALALVLWSDDTVSLALELWWDGRSVALLAIGDRGVALSPLLYMGESPCPVCAAATAADMGGPSVTLWLQELALGIIVRQTIALLSASDTTVWPQQGVQVAADSLATRNTSTWSQPGCPHCSAASEPLEQIPFSVRYEASVAVAPARFLPSARIDDHYRPEFLRLQSQMPRWNHCDSFPLPDVVPGPDLGPGVAEQPDALLAAVLRATVGLHDAVNEYGLPKRWAPSAANIGSPRGYVIAGAAGVRPSGVYAYVPEKHRLAKLSDVEHDGPDLLVLTSYSGVLEPKYGDRALKLSFLDVGCARAAATTVGSALGVRLSDASVTPPLHQMLREKLALDGSGERIAAVLAVDAASGRNRPDPTSQRLVDQLPGRHSVGSFAPERVPQDLVEPLLVESFADVASVGPGSPLLRAVVLHFDPSGERVVAARWLPDGEPCPLRKPTDPRLLTVQPAAATGSGIIVLVADLPAIFRQHGESGYFATLQVAGGLLYRFELRCAAARIGTGILGGVIAPALRWSLGLDGVSSAPLVACVFGKEPM
ncbi:hypothetical protein J5X07_08030 [Actinomyces bowdenii]|uniref:hypothetical protein n=1 Tax=Actinomyces bowdenii TaxID=131109 RepID=UPI001ABCE823|nr:hypothetical protein [Actinomyces bowdenii]MBO3724973.1 hypothetical protein [Actinomyces bowdenii]